MTGDPRSRRDNVNRTTEPTKPLAYLGPLGEVLGPWSLSGVPGPDSLELAAFCAQLACMPLTPEKIFKLRVAECLCRSGVGAVLGMLYALAY
jgi:hypothetical protein